MRDPVDHRATLTILPLPEMEGRLDCDWCPEQTVSRGHYGAATTHVTVRYPNQDPTVAFTCGVHYAEHFAGHKGDAPESN